MKIRLEVVGLSLACIFIVAIVIQATFGSGGIDLSIQPSMVEVAVGSTCTYDIALFTFEQNWFKITIIPNDTCDASWFEWQERDQVEVKYGKTKHISLNVTPSEAGDFNFTVRADTLLLQENSPEIDARIIATGASKSSKEEERVTCIGLQPNSPAPQKITAGQREIKWTAYACNSRAGEIEYRFKLNGPRTDYSTKTVKDWSKSNEWVWNADSRDVGNSTIYADVRARYHNYIDSYVYRDYELALIQLPCCTCLMPDKSEPQVGGTAIRWTACTSYPDQDQLMYRFWVHDGDGGWKMKRDWARSNSWTWTPGDSGDYDVKVEACDVRDSNASVGNGTYWDYSIVSAKTS